MRNIHIQLAKLALLVSTPLLILVGLIHFYDGGVEDITAREAERIRKIQTVRKAIAEPLAPFLSQNKLVPDLEAILDPENSQAKTKVHVTYTIDASLQVEAEKLLKSYKPDYGAIITMDAKTGKILAMASFQKSGDSTENLALRATYPAASLFKIVTATAAVDRYSLSPDTLVMFNGGNHTLYRKNVMSSKVNRWTRNMTLREAFARSINTVFGRLSLERLEPKDLEEYAIRFGFNKAVATDLPFNPGFFEMPTEKNFQMAEVASGYNKITKMSPIQGAMIAGSVAEDGLMRAPYIVDHLTDDAGNIVFQSEPVIAAVTMSPDGARRLKELMTATVRNGTGRKSFRKLVRDRKFEELEMGGKTGSLHGDSPKGKVDWFIGYAISENSSLAVAAITVNKEKWTVKSTYLAQSMFRKHFGTLFSRENEKFLSAADNHQNDNP